MRGASCAKVLEIVEKFPDIINSHLLADKIIIHIGMNDILKQQSEILKHNFCIFLTL